MFRGDPIVKEMIDETAQPWSLVGFVVSLVHPDNSRCKNALAIAQRRLIVV
jgi:hypothetical protein